jgi:hypothetical protein
MLRARAWLPLIAAGLIATGVGAAPAPPSYQGVLNAVERARGAWGTTPADDPGRVQWEGYAGELQKELGAYGAAQGDADRLGRLDALYRRAIELQQSPWAPANEVGRSLADWLGPRVSLAWAVRRLEDSIAALPPTTDPARQSHRQGWLSFVGKDLGNALQGYESARSVADRVAALEEVRSVLRDLGTRNRQSAWPPSSQLQSALVGLFDRPNLEATADVWTLAPFLSQNIVQPGPIYRNGQVAYVTPGAKTGFGLMASNDGVAFFNRQLMRADTQIRGFQEQIAADQKGQRAAKMYQFGAATTNTGETTAVVVVRPSGLSLNVNSTNNVQLCLTSAPQAGGGFGRAIAGVVGFGQRRILDEVYRNAYPQVAAGVEQGAREEAAERSAQAQAEQNARLAAFLIGNDTLAINQIAVSRLDLGSQPTYAWLRGNLQWRDQGAPVGADAPKPAHFATTAPGVTADVHITSALHNLAEGYLTSPAAQGVQTLTVVTTPAPAGSPADARPTIRTVPNADYATFLKEVQQARATGDARAQAIRVKRPTKTPSFAADASGNLVAFVPDFQLDVPAPTQGGALAGPKAQVYRIEAPRAEFALNVAMQEATADAPRRLAARVAAFDPGPGARVVAIDEDESKATPLNAFTSSLVLSVLRNRIQGQPLNLPLDSANLGGFALAEVTPLDPSGWMRVVLQRNGQ